MSQIKPTTMVILAAFVVLLGACGSSTKNEKAGTAFDTETGTHTDAGWLPQNHCLAALADLTSCKECHGESLNGGVAGVSCTQCHLGAPESVHPLDWDDLVLLKHGAYVGSSVTTSHGNTSCANAYCHGSNLTGVTNSGPSCTSCHMDGVSSAHLSNWTSPLADHRDYLLLFPGNLTSCANAKCHGSKFTGVVGSGPSCTKCHAETFYNCTSCHDQPPATGKHVFHVVTQKKACVECHQLTSALHDNGTVNLVSTITYSFTSRACTPSCHGQKTWPQ